MKAKFLSIYQWTVAIAFFLLVIWGTNKGFDLRDEGYYLLGYTKTQEIGLIDTQFHTITKVLFGFLDIDVVTARVLRMVLNIFIAVVISFSITVFLGRKDKSSSNFYKLLSFALIGTFSSYGMGIQAISYNTWNTFFIGLSASLLILFLSNIEVKYKYILLAGLGIVGVFNFFNKFPSGILQMVLDLAVIFSVSIRDKRKLFKNLFLFFVGILAGLLLFNTFFVDIRYALDGISYSLNMLTNSPKSGYTTLAFISNIISSLFQLLDIIVFAAGFYYIQKLICEVKKPFNYILFILLVIGAYNIILIKYLQTFGSLYILIPLFYLAMGHYKEIIKLPYLTILCMGIIFIEPFIGSVGSNAPILVNSAYYNVFFVVLIWYLLKLTRKKVIDFTIKNVLIVALIVLPAVHFYIYHPFSQFPMFKQKVRLSFLDNNKNLMVDRDTFDFIKDIYDHTKDYSDSPVIGFYKMPGIIYLLGRNSPGSISYDRTGSPLFCENLSHSNMSLKNTVVLYRDKVSDYVIECLKRQGIDFQNYKSVYIKSNSEQDHPSLSLYLPY